MYASKPRHSRGYIWFRALAGAEPRIDTGLRTVLVADVQVASQQARLIAVVPDALDDHAAPGELGLEEGWVLADQVRDMIAADRGGAKRPIITIVDAKSQAHGRIEELLGISASCAAAADAYAAARKAGHPLIALVVGLSAPGAFLAHGYQAHRLLAFDNLAAADARDTRYQGGRGKLFQLIAGIDAEAPSRAQIGLVVERVAQAVADVRNHPGDLTLRLSNDESMLDRAAGEVRRRFPEPWGTLDQLFVAEAPAIRLRAG
jgi:malonate decarboxylase gamma subunit